MKLNWNFLGGVGVQNKKPSVGGVRIFSGTTQLPARSGLKQYGLSAAIVSEYKQTSWN